MMIKFAVYGNAIQNRNKQIKAVKKFPKKLVTACFFSLRNNTVIIAKLPTPKLIWLQPPKVNSSIKIESYH